MKSQFFINTRLRTFVFSLDVRIFGRLTLGFSLKASLGVTMRKKFVENGLRKKAKFQEKKANINWH